MQSRTYLRIEGDLVSLVTEEIDREVELPDLLAELATNQPISPAGCPPAAVSGPRWATREVFVVEQPRCGGRSSTTRANVPASEPVDLPARAPVRRLRRRRRRRARSRASRLTSERARSARSTIGSLARACRTRRTTASSASARSGQRATVGERVDALIGAFWASRFNQDLRRHPLPFSGGFRAWASRSPTRSARGPVPSHTTPPGGPSARSSRRWRRAAGHSRPGAAEPDISESEVVTPIPEADGRNPKVRSRRRDAVRRPKEATPMRRCLRRSGPFRRRSRAIAGRLIGPQLVDSAVRALDRRLEDAALTIAVAALRASGRRMRDALV